jgi:hypothetical protein
MKTLIQKIHVEEKNSFTCRLYRTKHFETNWHKYEEYELILITEGHGMALIGDYIGDYKPGDIYFLGTNVAGPTNYLLLQKSTSFIRSASFSKLILFCLTNSLMEGLTLSLNTLRKSLTLLAL